MSSEEGPNAFELLNVSVEASDAEIRTAYRKLSLKVHPDRNPNNPTAAQKFHELNQAYELLLDPLRRLALTSSLKASLARKARFAKFDQKRKNLQEELEQREREFKKRKLDEAKEKQERENENTRIMEEGKKLLERRIIEERQKKEKIKEEEPESTEEDVPPLGDLDTTVKLKFTLSRVPHFSTTTTIAKNLSQFGEIDESSVVLSLKEKPVKSTSDKSSSKKALRTIATALVPFRTIGGAFAAVCASKQSRNGLAGCEISWAGGEEPPIVQWLRRIGKLGNPNSDSIQVPTAKQDTYEEMAKSKSTKDDISLESLLENASKKESIEFGSGGSFSSFPDLSSMPATPHSPFQMTTSPALQAAGLDFESLTLMRLRQAERDRLEREILEAEAAET